MPSCDRRCERSTFGRRGTIAPSTLWERLHMQDLQRPEGYLQRIDIRRTNTHRKEVHRVD